MENQIEIAREIAIEAHKGQFRRDGVTPYHTHPEAVAAKVSEAAKAVAWLHDVLEDCSDYNAHLLAARGVGPQIIEAVCLLTKSPGMDYDEYILRLKTNPLAREVKIADIQHNLASNPKPEKIKKYRRALEILDSEQR